MSRRFGAQVSARQGATVPEELQDPFAVTRFWLAVAVRSKEQCWIWGGDTDRDGYGVFSFRGRKRQAHELALSFATGESRHPSMDTCHSCDNPACCNPSHLRFDTRQGNVDDMLTRGRNAHGSKCKNTRLTEAQVLAIRLRRASGAPIKSLASQYGISVSAVTAIAHGKNWKSVGGPITNRNTQGAK